MNRKKLCSRIWRFNPEDPDEEAPCREPRGRQVEEAPRLPLLFARRETTMKIALALAVAGAALVVAMATTAFSAPKTGRVRVNVSVSYVPPKNPAHQVIYERLKERRALEKLQEILSPFRLPTTLKVSLAGCDGEADAYYREEAITICYEYIDELWKRMPAETTADGVTPIDAVLGPLFDTSLHEFSHALIDMLELPVLGREEDAADQMASYIILQFGKAESRRLIMGTAYAYKIEAEGAATPPSLKEFGSEHGTPAQRAYNVLCIAYGADPKLFGDLVTKGYLPKKRAEVCEEEYQQIEEAFESLINRHIDRARAKGIWDKSWIPEATARVPRRPGSSGPARAQ
jgi:Putative metallopeptidase